jgi:DNA-binding NarL/FixJ family response regulator
MRELVLETIIEQPDIEIVAEIQNEAEIPAKVKETHPDFLIIALDDSDARPPLCDTLLRSFPEMRILALAPERNIGTFFWASSNIHSAPVEASEDGILQTLRREGKYAVGG